MYRTSASNYRRIFLLSHTVLLVAVWLFLMNPGDPGHVFPCLAFLDLPALFVLYYGGAIIGLLLDIDPSWALRGQRHLIGLLFMGGSQWYVIGLGIDYWRRKRTRIDSRFCLQCNNRESLTLAKVPPIGNKRTAILAKLQTWTHFKLHNPLAQQLRSIHSQLKERKAFPVDVWERHGFSVATVRSVLKPLREAFCWPNDHFYPNDPLRLVLCDWGDGFRDFHFIVKRDFGIVLDIDVVSTFYRDDANLEAFLNYVVEIMNKPFGV